MHGGGAMVGERELTVGGKGRGGETGERDIRGVEDGDTHPPPCLTPTDSPSPSLRPDFTAALGVPPESNGTNDGGGGRLKP